MGTAWCSVMTGAMTRRNIGVKFFALPLILNSPFLWAQSIDQILITRLKNRLSDEAIVRGRFEQSKQIKGFKQPLLSKGNFVTARQKGVIWQTREPIESLLVLTKNRMSSRQADGRLVHQIDSNREPMAKLIIELMFAMLSPDLDTLSQRFKFEGSVLEEVWNLVLTPKDASLMALIPRIESQGNNYVRFVQWRDSMGDITQIRMFGQQASPALSHEEEAYFG